MSNPRVPGGWALAFDRIARAVTGTPTFESKAKSVASALKVLDRTPAEQGHWTPGSKVNPERDRAMIDLLRAFPLHSGRAPSAVITDATKGLSSAPRIQLEQDLSELRILEAAGLSVPGDLIEAVSARVSALSGPSAKK